MGQLVQSFPKEQGFKEIKKAKTLTFVYFIVIEMPGELNIENWPEKDGHFKIVLLTLDGDPYMLVAAVPDVPKPSHPELLKEFLTKREVSYLSVDGENNGQHTCEIRYYRKKKNKISYFFFLEFLSC